MLGKLCFACLASSAFAPVVVAQEPFTTALISTVQREKDWFCSISAPRAPLNGLVEQLTRSMQIEVEGLDLISPTALVTVELRDRPAEQVLEWMLGSAGLRAHWRTGAVQIRPLTPASPTPDELRDCALASYSAALRSFPDASAGAAAAFSKASIYEHRGDVDQAIASFDSLVRAYPQSTQAPEALIRSARQLYLRGDYAAAGAHYADLLRISANGPLVLEARVGFASSLAHQGEHQSALRLLAALDTTNPALTRLDLHRRLLIRARAVLGEGNASGARRLLAESQNGGLEAEFEAEYCELSALALPGDAPPEYGAVVWMDHARHATGSARENAAGEAARLTRLAGDELGALWIDRWAKLNDGGDATTEHANAAREALGLDPQSLHTNPAEDRLARAERLMHARLWTEGHSAFLAVRESAPPMGDAQRTRLYVGLARCLDGQDRADDAITMLREGLELVSEADHRREFYVCAATIFEAHARVDD
ncbi:MAG: tetratricopeptide repeat protein, partial [Planctomycetota bacterium]